MQQESLKKLFVLRCLEILCQQPQGSAALSSHASCCLSWVSILSGSVGHGYLLALLLVTRGAREKGVLGP